MRNLYKYALSAASLLALLALPLTGLAAGLTNFFSPPSSDISMQVMQNIFGTGTDIYNGKLIRPLLLVFSSGIVIFMGAIFAWNLTKFVLHTAQEGEMAMGKGKTMGLVVLRSIFGLSMVVPIYGATAYKGLSLSFVFVAWVITQGIGLADQGVNAAVDYLQAGGTLYQNVTQAQDNLGKQSLADPVLGALTAQSCLHRLRQIALSHEAQDKETEAGLREAGQPPSTRTPIQASDFGYKIDESTGTAMFGTRNTNPRAIDNPYLAECGQLNWGSLFSNKTDAASKNYDSTINTAMRQIIMDTDALARRIAQANPIPPNAQPDALKTQALGAVPEMVFSFANLIGPIRDKDAAQRNAAVYAEFQKIKTQGWIVLGAYYPMMGKLNQENKAPLGNFTARVTEGDLAVGKTGVNSDSAYFAERSLSPQEISQFKDQASYLRSYATPVKEQIMAIEGVGTTLQEQLALAAALAAAGVNTSGPFSFMSNANAPAHWGESIRYGVGQGLNKVNAGGEAAALLKLNDLGVRTGPELGGVLEKKKLQESAAMVSIASIAGGPISMMTIIPIAQVMVDTMERFKEALDYVKNPDPLMALQDFGFYVMGQAVLLLGIVIGGTFLVSAIFGAIPSPFAPATAVLSQTSTLVAPIFAMFFAALAAAGFGFGIYIPMIPLIVWISAILGWIGHSFQAIVGAPLVALRMTTAEGEGLLGGATEGVMMLLGVLLTPFLLVLGFVANLIILKQVLIVVNYLFSLFVSYSFGPRSGGLSMQSIAWAMIGAPAILLVYFTLITGVVQALATKLIGEFPGEILRHLHNSMTGHRAAERMEGKMEGASDRGAGQAGELGGKGANLGAAQQAMMKPHEDRANAKANANKPKPNDDK